MIFFPSLFFSIHVISEDFFSGSGHVYDSPSILICECESSFFLFYFILFIPFNIIIWIQNSSFIFVCYDLKPWNEKKKERKNPRETFEFIIIVIVIIVFGLFDWNDEKKRWLYMFDIVLCTVIYIFFLCIFSCSLFFIVIIIIIQILKTEFIEIFFFYSFFLLKFFFILKRKLNIKSYEESVYVLCVRVVWILSNYSGFFFLSFSLFFWFFSFIHLSFVSAWMMRFFKNLIVWSQKNCIFFFFLTTFFIFLISFIFFKYSEKNSELDQKRKK